ncbi:beta-alanyl-bioamine nonribosomal peptide synthetase ebony-like [Oratosquilla oratoria]|uniref:beta-alanyl-bioamine nonribosomal peptide synthetase ebony-like n=1 Tax=Oratosquilla oratoria TaxID=337810 RepID=UPI003F7615C3
MMPISVLHEVLEEEMKESLKKEGGRWMHNLLLATHPSLHAKDNVRLVLHLEKELLRLTKAKHLAGVFTVNSNRLNQELCQHYLGYERHSSIRVVNFVYKGRRPFASLPEDLSLVAMTKRV